MVVASSSFNGGSGNFDRWWRQGLLLLEVMAEALVDGGVGNCIVLRRQWWQRLLLLEVAVVASFAGGGVHYLIGW